MTRKASGGNTSPAQCRVAARPLAGNDHGNASSITTGGGFIVYRFIQGAIALCGFLETIVPPIGSHQSITVYGPMRTPVTAPPSGDNALLDRSRLMLRYFYQCHNQTQVGKSLGKVSVRLAGALIGVLAQ